MVIIQIRRDTSANWTTNNPILAEGELGFELDTDKFKKGNGVDDWNTLSYPSYITGSGSTINALTFNNSGSGDVSGTAFDGSIARTLSYNSVGATPSIRTISTTSPLSGGGDLSVNRTLSIGDAIADGSTKGAASFNASDFNSSSGNISIDYTNGQASSTSTKGFLPSTDWNTFNNKQNAITTGSTSQYFRGNLSLATFPTLVSSFTNDAGYLTTIAGISAGGELTGTYTNPSLSNSAVIGKVLTGLNVTGGSVLSTDSILAAFGKLQNQVNGLAGGVSYQGVWNATTNTPTLATGVGTKGWYYKVSIAGSTSIDGINDWKVGDLIIYNGTAWDKIDNTDSVSSVNGYTGAVSLVTSDITENTNLYFTNTRSIGSSLTGYSSTTGTISSSDTILTAIEKLNGNSAALITGVSSVFGRTGVVIAASNDYTFAQLASKPTTLSGYGITDAYPLSGNPSGFLTSYTETDPVVAAINGIVKSNGTTISAAVVGTDYVTGSSTNTFTNKSGNISQWTNDSGYITSISGAVTSVSGTASRITSTGGATPIIDISASYIGQSSITTLGTIGTGTWQGTAIGDTYISSASAWNAKQDAISLTTTGSSGASTFISNTLNIPNYTLSGLGGVPTTRTLTINGTTFDLSANRTWTVGDALVASPLSQFAATTSAQLAGIISDETGSGALVFATSPTLVTPTFAKIANLTSNGFIKTSGGDGTLSIDTNTYLTSFTETDPVYTSLGTPKARTLTINGTTLDLSADRSWTVGNALVSNPLSQFASTTSAQLRAVISDELGTGAALFDGATPTSFILTNATGLPNAGLVNSSISLSGHTVSLGSNLSLVLASADFNSQGTVTTILHGSALGNPSWGQVVNADVSSSAAITYSKLALSNGIVNSDVNTSAAIAYSKLALSNSILNADINSSAAIVYSKLSLGSSILNSDLAGAVSIAKGGLNKTSIGTNKFPFSTDGSTYSEGTGRQGAEETYSITGSILFTGTTSPATLTNATYRWTQVLNMVTARFFFSWTTAGSALTNVQFDFPANLPAPEKPTGFTADGVLIALGFGGMSASLTGDSAANSRTGLHSLASSSTGYSISSTAGSVNTKAVAITIIYFTASGF